MGYLGNQPTAVPIQSSDLADGIVTNAKLGTDISAAKLTAGTLADARFPATLPALNGSNLTNISAGKILQVTSNKIVGERNSNSTSYIATNIHHNITPASSSNKVLVMVTLPSLYVSYRGYANRVRLYRHSSVVSVGGSTAGTEINGDFHMNYQGGNDMQTAKTAYTELDSPSSTSAVYYQIYMSTSNSSNTFYIGQGGGSPVANITLMEIEA